MGEREPYPPDEDENTEPPVPESVPAEVPEADAIEQAAPLAGPVDDEPATVGDRPEADAIEQATEVAEPDDDEYRG
jgi:hypothetical protein